MVRGSLKSYLFIIGAGILCSVFGTEAKAQRTCGTDAYEAQMIADNPKYRVIKNQIWAETQQWIQNNLNSQTSKKAVITVPVVVHVIYNTGAQNISDAQVLSQIDVLNEDYRRTNADASNTPSAFTGVAADCEIEFCLAQQDPSGNASNGITRTSTSNTSFPFGDAMKQNSQGGKDGWPRADYLNIWVCNLGGGLLGFATPPGGIAWRDGVVIKYNYFGRVGTVSAPFDEGRTATHEIGHWLNLDHTFNGGCAGTSSSNCASAGDFICDTPPTSTPNYFCPSNTQNSCTETPTDQNDMHMNFMDYTNDACMNLFTAGQKNVMIAALDGIRLSIQSSIGCVNPAGFALDAGISLIITPTGSPCNTSVTPVVRIQNYGTTTLTIATINYDVDSGANNTYSWTGSLATNATEDVTLPTITVSSGSHTFNSSTSNPNSATDMNTGNDATSQAFTITAGSGAPLPFTEGFEGVTFPPTGWVLNNPNANVTWSRVTTASGFGNSSACMQMDFYSGAENIQGQSDYLYTVDIDLSNATSPTLMDFNLAYTRYDSAYYDSLYIFGSIDCGVTWQQIYKNGDSGMQTAPDDTVPFTPTSAQWTTESINLDAYNGSNGFQLQFHAKSYWGNNLYIDDINIYTTAGGPAPIANFTSSATNICEGQSVTFADMSTNSPTQWAWSFTGGTPNSSTVQNPSIIYNSAGTYTVALTASNGNGSDTKTTTAMITVIAGPSVAATSVNTICAGACDGSASSAVTGGTAPYSYYWNSSPAQITTIATGLCAGNYAVAVEDANGCGSTDQVTVGEPAAITTTTTSIDAQCGIADGTASIVANSGVSPYSYLWSNGQSTSTANNLAAAIYDVTITDANGCTAETSVSVNNIGAPTVFTSAQSTMCFGSNDGSATITATGGSTPYNFLWSDGASQTSATATSLSAGIYNVTLTDASGCIATSIVPVSEPGILITSMSYLNVSTGSSCDGSATASVSGGTPPYTYLWNDPASQTTVTAASLCLGTQSVAITDANGCTSSGSIYLDSIVMGIFNIPKEIEFNIYPNPTTGIIHFDFGVDDNRDINVTIFDISGKVIVLDDVTKSSRENYSVNLSEFSRGIYYVRVHDGKTLQTKKVSLIR